MAGTLKLYYLPGSCALAPHIALEHAGASNTCLRSVMSSVSICPSSRSASVESERSTSFGIRRVRRISFRKVITAQGLHKWGRPKGPWTLLGILLVLFAIARYTKYQKDTKRICANDPTASVCER
jgi:hypothetical protein